MKMESGQTLVEVVAALGIAIIVITAIALTVISSLNNTNFSKNQHFATQYAQQGMEQMRLLRDTDYATFSLYSTGSYCLPKDSITPEQKDPDLSVVGCKSVALGSSSQNVDIFARQVDIEVASSECEYENPIAPTPAIYSGSGTKVTVSVSWRDGKCNTAEFCHDVELVSCFSNYNVVATPGLNP